MATGGTGAAGIPVSATGGRPSTAVGGTETVGAGGSVVATGGVCSGTTCGNTCVDLNTASYLAIYEAVIASAIVAESSYNPSSNNLDDYGRRSLSGGTANDPTVGLLQIRFSSTVQDYNYYGPLAKMAAIGCAWPTELSSHSQPSRRPLPARPSILPFGPISSA